MPPSARDKSDRIFVKDGRRSYRRRYNTTETRIGLAILVVLAAVVGWVAWRGANPDPTLFALDSDLSQVGAVAEVDRGPVPGELAAAGWSEDDLSRFDYDNLYVKINGREGYYKSFGFEQLYFLSIESETDPATVVDIELYDLGTPANAAGAYAGERAPGIEPEITETGMMHIDRNALYMTRGRYYLRAIGSDESPVVRAELEHLRDRFVDGLPGEPLPWGYALLVAEMGISPGAISYSPEDAFSFGFAKNVYAGTLEDGGELFVTPAESDAAALARQFREGFLQYGETEGDYIKDRYLGTYATAVASGNWVVGIQRANDPGAAAKAVARLADRVRELPLPEAAPPANADGEESTPEDERESDADAY